LGKVAHPGEKIQKERNNLEDADVNGRILKGTLKKYTGGGGCGLG
jgi:hypothetical protein